VQRGGGPAGGRSVAARAAARQQRGVLVGTSVAARACADAQLDRLTPEHLSVSLEREDDLDRATTEPTHARAEAHELEQIRHPVRSG